MLEDLSVDAVLDPKDLKKVNRLLDTLGGDEGGVQRRAMKRATLYLLSKVRRGFVQGGVHPETGKPGYWPETARGNPPLQDTGRLLNSISMRIEGEGDNLSGIVGTNVSYAKYHEQPDNDGGGITFKPSLKQRWYLFFKYGWRLRKDTRIHIPQRRIFVLPKPWRQQVADTYIKEIMRQARGG